MEIILGVGFTVWAVNSVLNANDNNPDLSIQNSLMTRITSNAITSIHTGCSTIVTTEQSINIVADEKYSEALNTTESATASKCGDIVTEFERILAKHDPSGKFYSYYLNYVSMRPDDKGIGVIYDMQSGDGTDSESVENETIQQESVIVRYLCEPLSSSVIVNNITQMLEVKAESKCTASNDVLNTVSSSVSGYIDSTLSNDQDLAGIVADSLSGSSESISNSYSTMMGTYADTNIRQILDNRVNSSQNITFDNVSSIVARNIHQNSNIVSNATAEFITATNNDITQSVEYQLMQTLKNQNNTIKDITGVLINGIEQMSEFIETSAGAYMIIVVVILVCGIFCLLNYRLYKDRINQKKDGQKAKTKIEPDSSMDKKPSG